MNRPPPPRPLPASLAARFETLGVLGHGGMGIVYRVRDRPSGRLAALKVMLLPPSDALQKRFLIEAETLAKVKHPHVLQHLAHGICPEGETFLVTALLEGHGMDALPPGTAIRQPLLDVARGLDAVHRAGVLHRDIKPGNMFCTHEGRGVLIDFGLVKDPERTALTKTGAFVGTARFLAPEVFTGGEATAAADWYAWGVSLYRLIFGACPYEMSEVMAAAQTGQWAPPDLRHLDPDSPEGTLLRGLLTADPARRIQRLDQVEALLAPRPAPTPRPETWTISEPLEPSPSPASPDPGSSPGPAAGSSGDLGSSPAARSGAHAPPRLSTTTTASPTRAGPRAAAAVAVAAGFATTFFWPRPAPPAPRPAPAPPSAPAARPPIEVAGEALQATAARLFEVTAPLRANFDDDSTWADLRKKKQVFADVEVDRSLDDFRDALIEYVELLSGLPDPEVQARPFELFQLLTKVQHRVFGHFDELEEDIGDIGFLARLKGGAADPREVTHESRRATIERMQGLRTRFHQALAWMPASQAALLVRLMMAGFAGPAEAADDNRYLDQQMAEALPPEYAFCLLFAATEQASRFAKAALRGHPFMARRVLSLRPFLALERPGLTPPQASSLLSSVFARLLGRIESEGDPEVLAATRQLIDLAPAVIDAAPGPFVGPLDRTVQRQRRRKKVAPAILDALQALLDRATRAAEAQGATGAAP